VPGHKEKTHLCISHTGMAGSLVSAVLHEPGPIFI